MIFYVHYLVTQIKIEYKVLTFIVFLIISAGYRNNNLQNAQWSHRYLRKEIKVFKKGNFY